MGLSVLQPSFTGGEISPSLYARVDLARYTTSLRLCRNWIVQRHGGVTTRPGFQYLGGVAAGGTLPTLVAFSISATQDVLIEFGDTIIRFWRNGALETTWTLTPAPWTAAQVGAIKVAQVGSVMIVCHPEVAPQQLTFVSTVLGFTQGPLSFAPTIAAPAVSPALAPDTITAPTKTYEYVYTLIDDITGDESLPSPVATTTAQLSSTKPIQVAGMTGATVKNIYRGRNGVFGFIGTSTGTGFVDDDLVPDFSSPPPNWTNPFTGAGNYPSTVTHFQQRRFFGGSINNPQTLYGSRSSELKNFGAASPARDDDAIDATLAATQGQAIQHLVPLSRLIVMTTRGEWSADAGSDAVLTPNNTGFSLESAFGANTVQPVLTGDGAVYVQAQGTRVRDLVFNQQIQQYGGTDLSVLASHLFEGYSITDLAWASYPHSCVWCVRNDGVLLSLTYLRDQEVWGWAQHQTDGTVERVAVVREGQQDVLYAVIRRTGPTGLARYIERLTNRFPTDVRLHVNVDSALTYDGRNVDPAKTLTLSGAAWAVGTPLTATFVGYAAPSATVDDEIHVRDTAGATILRLRVTAITTPSLFTVQADRDVAAALQGSPTTRWGWAESRLSGLSHLEGREVALVVDGNVDGTQVVAAGGIITPQLKGCVVHAGLPYTCRMETLDLSFGMQTQRDRQKIVSKITVHVEASRGLSAGTDENDLVEIKQRESESYDDPIALFTGTQDVNIPSRWREPGRIIIEQSEPLPATVLAVIPEVSLGG